MSTIVEPELVRHDDTTPPPQIHWCKTHDAHAKCIDDGKTCVSWCGLDLSNAEPCESTEGSVTCAVCEELKP